MRPRNFPYRRPTQSQRIFRPRADRTYIVFNKPYGVLTQFTSPDGSDKRTLAEFGFPSGVYPVGRLDFDSEGLLLLSDDAELNAALLHPDRSHERTYLVQVENVPTPADLSAIRDGVLIQGHRTRPAQVRLIDREPDLPARSAPIRFRRNIPTAWIELTLTEGRNRQVRRMTAAIGCPTLRLVRTGIGLLRIDRLELAPGTWRHLSEHELQSAFNRQSVD